MHDNADWWSGYAAGFELLDYPVMIVRGDAEVLWANSAARTHGIERAYEHAKGQQFFLPNDSTYFELLLSGSTVFVPADDFLEDRMNYCFRPVLEGGELLGCIVTLHMRENSAEARYVTRFERGTTVFDHQMRSGISTIFSALSGIANRNNSELGDPRLRELAATITAQTYRLMRTNVHITQFGRYKYMGAQVNPQWQDIIRFTEQLCQAVSPMVQERVHFTYALPEGPTPVRFDSHVISAVLLELISNAVKFSAEEGAVHLRLTIGAKTADFCVEDNGLGIAGELLGQVFDPFFSHDPRTRGICGDGLGLWLCREDVLAHGGSVMLDSVEGQGTRAAFSLPLGQEAPPQKLAVHNLASEYMRNRFSGLYVLLADVCRAPEQ